MKPTFRQQVRQQVEQVSLDPRQLQALQALSSTSVRPRWPALAAIIVLIIAPLLYLNTTSPPTVTHSIASRALMIEAIADEVAANHLKMKPLEVSSAGIERLRDYFTALSFKPIESLRLTQLGSGKMTLLGARYCSIQGVSAAQLRYQAVDQRWTLYQVPITDFTRLKLAEKGDIIETYGRGLRITLWRERGLLMALIAP